MKEERFNTREKYLLAELVFSFVLLSAIIFLFGEALASLRPYFILGLAGGLYFSWLRRDKKTAGLYLSINIAVLAVFIWVFYAVYNSSLFYKDIILLFVKAGFILSVLLSLGALGGFLVYIDALSIVLLMCFPIFVNNYEAYHYLLLAICLFSWVVLLRLRFKKAFTLAALRPFERNYPGAFAFALLLFIILSAWTLFYAMPLKSIKDRGFFIEPTGAYGIAETPSEQKYYELQEKLQDEILEAMPNLESRGEILGDLSSLVKDSADVMEVKKARDGLMDKLRRPGPGLERDKAGHLLLLLDAYLDQKIKRNLKMSKEQIIENLKSNPFSIKDRFSVLARLNKMQYEDSVKKVASLEQGLKTIIAESSVSQGVKREIGNDLAQFERWKYYQLYRRQFAAFKKTADSLDNDSRGKLNELISAFERMDSSSSLSAVDGKIRILRYSGGREAGAVADQADGVFDVVSRMVAAAGKTANEYKSGPGQKQEVANREGAGGGEEYKKLISLEILPEYCRIALGATKDLLAMGIYGDGSHQDLTAEALWSSGDERIVSVVQGMVSAAGIGKGRVYAEIDGIKSRAAMVMVEEPQLVAINLSPSELTIPLRGSSVLKAEGVFSNGERRDMTSSVEWKAGNDRLIRVFEGNVHGLRIGSTSVYAERAAVRSASVEVKVTMTLFWAAVLLFKLALASAVLLGILFAVFYALTEERRKKIRMRMDVEPRRFVIEVYGNTRAVLAIFGPRPDRTTPPLAYAAEVKGYYPAADNVYTGLTRLFEEAKYSSHAISDDDAREALAAYNTFISTVLGCCGRGRMFWGRCLILLLKIPLHI